MLVFSVASSAFLARSDGKQFLPPFLSPRIAKPPRLAVERFILGCANRFLPHYPDAGCSDWLASVDSEVGEEVI